MGTKYSHEGGVRAAREAHRTPYRRMAQRGKAPRGVRSLIWVVAICLVAVLLAFMASLYKRPGPERFAPRQGEAVVVEKSEAITGSLELHLRIKSGDREVGRVVQTVDRPLWELLDAGDRVAVLYRPDRQTGGVEVVEMGRFALPAEVQ